MTKQSQSRAQRATTVVPLALLFAAWTVQLAGASLSSLPAPTTAVAQLPALPAVPAQPVNVPASVSTSDDLPTSHEGLASVSAVSTTNDIPATALAAYQRAETVINAADKSCNLSWQLIAAIGRVESDHGRFDGGVLDDKGLARPGIFGPALDGRAHTALVRDTDAGRFDLDARFDHAVGPMQFIPSTWSVVGVDADNDGRRNPQDVDDASLGTAVYLCSGADDLSSAPGQRAAVHRYNHSASYVDLVLSVMQSYLDDGVLAPSTTLSAGYLRPTTAPVAPVVRERRDSVAEKVGHHTSAAGQPWGVDAAEPVDGPDNDDAATGPDATEPTGEPASGGDPESPVPGTPPAPEQPSDPPADPGDAPPPATPPVTELDWVPALHEQVALLSVDEAVDQCGLEGLTDDTSVDTDDYDFCVVFYSTPADLVASTTPFGEAYEELITALAEGTTGP